MQTTRMVCIFFTFGLFGCYSTGGEILGLVPAPKITKGTLVDGKYTAMDESFSVNSPFPEGGYEYTYMKIMERYSDFENQITFSSSAAPTEVYRVHIYKDVDYQKLGISSAEELEEHLLSMAKDIFESAYDTPLIQQDSETKSIGNLKADSHSFLQEIPERGGIFNRFMKA